MSENFDSTASLGTSASGYTPLEWTDERVSAMWEFYAATEENNYFSARFGSALLARIGSYIPHNKRVADYGCGRGQLTRHLAQNNSVLAVDFPQTLAQTQASFERKAAPNPVTFTTPDAVRDHKQTVSVVCFLETIEHLLPAWVEPTFENIRTLLEPGGLVICTCPNEENVAQAMVCCPTTKTYYHKYQHMKTFSATSLTEFMDAQGFDLVSVKAYNLGMTSFYARIKLTLLRITGRIKAQHALYPHLVYIGRKR